MDSCDESPALGALTPKILLIAPIGAFIGMSSFHPFKQCLKNAMIHIIKGVL
jgi:hypothetical protein